MAKNSKKSKIVIMGNHASGGLSLIKALNAVDPRLELCLYYVEKSVVDISHPQWEDPTLRFNCKPYSFILLENKRGLSRFFSRLKNIVHGFKILFDLIQYDYVLSFTGSLLDSRIWYYYFIKYQLKLYYAGANGSDIREECCKDISPHNKMLQYFRNSKKAFLLNIDMIHLPRRLGLKGYTFFPFAIDTEKYKPVSLHFEDSKTTFIGENLEGENRIRFFMPSNLDWGYSDKNKHRNSTKGNDRFFRAFARAIHQGLKAELIYLDRGPDKEAAKNLVQELGLQNYTRVLPEFKKNELIQWLNEVDVVVDQFDIGSFGTIALEAMSCQKPVLMYIEQEVATICYNGDMPPVINAKEEEEIFQAIVNHGSNPELLKEIGLRSREWVVRNHGFQVVGSKLLGHLA